MPQEQEVLRRFLATERPRDMYCGDCRPSSHAADNTHTTLKSNWRSSRDFSLTWIQRGFAVPNSNNHDPNSRESGRVPDRVVGLQKSTPIDSSSHRASQNTFVSAMGLFFLAEKSEKYMLGVSSVDQLVRTTICTFPIAICIAVGK